jgi:uncharacterized membrane protein
MTDEGHPRTFLSTVFRRPSFGGLVGALVFFWFSLTPTLLPRDWIMQAVITGAGAAIGYVVGVAIGALGRWALQRTGRADWGRSWSRSAWITLPVVAGLLLVLGLVQWPGWQNEQRDLVELAHISPAVVVVMAVAALAIFAVLVIVGRVVLYLVRALERFVQRFMPRELAWIITGVVVAIIVMVLSIDVVGKGFVAFVDGRFGPADGGTAEGVEQPTSRTSSGSPESLAAWETLGFEGRNFVAGAPTVDELEGFSGSAIAPIRVYAGVESADGLEAQADLVVDELERTGAADREIVVVVTTTGTGWVDPDAAQAIEYMHAGDTAIAALQYSFLPSWIQFLIGTEVAGEAGAALNDAVFAWWSDLPEPRPRLILFGESLGSLGLETALAGDSVEASLGNLMARADGVLLTGPTASNPIWQQVSAARQSGTPVWRPGYEGGRNARFANRPDEPALVGPNEWSFPRTLYFHHPSDPVGYWNLDLLWGPPEWVNDPIGYDVSPRVSWFPIITWGQVSADLIAGFSAPSGYGHNYAVDFVSGWTWVAPPDDWTLEDSLRLQEHLGF